MAAARKAALARLLAEPLNQPLALLGAAALVQVLMLLTIC